MNVVMSYIYTGSNVASLLDGEAVLYVFIGPLSLLLGLDLRFEVSLLSDMVVDIKPKLPHYYGLAY